MNGIKICTQVRKSRVEHIEHELEKDPISAFYMVREKPPVP